MPEVAIQTAQPATATPTLNPREQQALKAYEAAEAQRGVAAAAEAAGRAAQSALDNPAPAAEAAKPAEAAPAAKEDGTIKTPEEQKILGKFKTQADLEKAYTELEAKLSAKPAEKAGEAKAPLVSNEEMAQFAEAVSTSGDLSAEHYTALAARGLSPEIVRGYVEGLKARAAEHVKQTYEAAGGEAGYKAMSEWAAKNVPEEQIKVFNADVRSGDKARVSAAVTGLYSRYIAAGNSPATQSVPARTQGTASQSGATQEIGSADELTLLMSSVQYKTNPAFRAEVARRLAMSQGL